MTILNKYAARCITRVKDAITAARLYAEKKVTVVTGLNTNCIPQTVGPSNVATKNISCLSQVCKAGNRNEVHKTMYFRELGLFSSSFIIGGTHSSEKSQRKINLISKCRFHTSPVKRIMEDRQTKALTVWNNLRELRASPLPAFGLGMSGLLPFVGVPAYMLFSSSYLPQLAFAQVAYGAAILSFLGGVRWGFTIPEENPVPPDWKNLGYSVMPSLVAWAGLMMPHPFSLFTVIGGLSAVAYFDMAMYGYPPWFKGLRFVLSFVAVLSLWTTFVLSLLLSTKNNSSIFKLVKDPERKD